MSIRLALHNDRSIVSGTGNIPRAMKCDFVVAVKHLVLRVDVIYREIGVDDNVADDEPITVEVLQPYGDRIVISREDLTVGGAAQGRDAVGLGLHCGIYRPA